MNIWITCFATSLKLECNWYASFRGPCWDLQLQAYARRFPNIQLTNLSWYFDIFRYFSRIFWIHSVVFKELISSSSSQQFSIITYCKPSTVIFTTGYGPRAPVEVSSCTLILFRTTRAGFLATCWSPSVLFRQVQKSFLGHCNSSLGRCRF